jgi:hypothetical protein
MAALEVAVVSAAVNFMVVSFMTAIFAITTSGTTSHSGRG